MKKPILLSVSTFVLLFPLAVSAQTPAPALVQAETPPPGDSQQPPATSAPDLAAIPAPPPVLPPDAIAPPDDAAPAPETVDQRVSTVEGKLEGVDESLAAARSTIDKLNRIKVSGYIQGRFEWHADSSNYLNQMNANRNTNAFGVRRSRLKVAYDGINAEYLFQIDAVPNGVSLRDAEATFVDTWTPLSFRLTVGQFKWPFGYEILQSSGDREMPERSSVIRALFPSERDRGLRLTARHDWFRFAFALVNGNGTALPIDTNSFKDAVVRVSGDFGWLVVGLSGYLGQRLTPTAPRPQVTTWVDRNTNGVPDMGEVTTTSGMATPAATYASYSLLRAGADAQIYADIPGIGGFALKGEFVFAKDWNRKFGTASADRCLDRTHLGWIVTAVQNIGDYVGAVVRVDSYDPNFTKALNSACTAANAMGLGDRRDTYGFGAIVYPSGNIKGTFVYEHVEEQSNTVRNNVFTAQLQARF